MGIACIIFVGKKFFKQILLAASNNHFDTNMEGGKTYIAQYLIWLPIITFFSKKKKIWSWKGWGWYFFLIFQNQATSGQNKAKIGIYKWVKKCGEYTYLKHLRKLNAAKMVFR